MRNVKRARLPSHDKRMNMLINIKKVSVYDNMFIHPVTVCICSLEKPIAFIF